jgi:hypothetical protein
MVCEMYGQAVDGQTKTAAASHVKVHRPCVILVHKLAILIILRVAAPNSQ